MLKNMWALVAVCALSQNLWAAVCVDVNGDEMASVSSFDRLMLSPNAYSYDKTMPHQPIDKSTSDKNKTSPDQGKYFPIEQTTPAQEQATPDQWKYDQYPAMLPATVEFTVSGCDLVGYWRALAHVERSSAEDSPGEICRGDTIFGFTSSGGFLGSCQVQNIWVSSRGN